MRIGIFSGTFDPIHLGHIKAGHIAIKENNLELLYFIPEEKPRYKVNSSEFHHRLEMVRLALSDEPEFKVWRANEPSHNMRTLKNIAAFHPEAEIFLLIGNDVHLNKWDEISKIKSMAKIITISRELFPVSSTQIRNDMKKNPGSLPLPEKIIEYIEKNELYK